VVGGGARLLLLQALLLPRMATAKQTAPMIAARPLKPCARRA
jgi:hypothetical protein